jgi:hypothetical protein
MQAYRRDGKDRERARGIVDRGLGSPKTVLVFVLFLSELEDRAAHTRHTHAGEHAPYGPHMANAQAAAGSGR